MSENPSLWSSSSLFLGCWRGVDQSSTGQGKKNKYIKSSSSYSSNSSNNIPFLPEDLSLTLANLHAFTFAEIKIVTRNFSNRIGEGWFGPIYKGFIPDKLRPGLEAQHAAVRDLDPEGLQGRKEWLAEVMYIGELRHCNLVTLIGYCCEEEHRMLVYEFMPCGNLENHLFTSVVDSLTWSQRMKIAVQTAKGLAFLHEPETNYLSGV